MAYGYVRDKEPLSINWAEISKNFNDRLAADEAERQGKRDDIQKQYDELSQQLIDKPTGADTDLNSAIASFTTQASQASLDALNRLKRGEISEQEYYNRRANLKSSTNNLFLYANNFNGQLEENLKLIQSQDPDNQGSGRMAFQMALAQDMLNFKNTVAVIDPATDEVMLVKTDEEGNPTNEVVSVSQLGNLSSQKENSYNYKGKIARALENRGVSKYQTDDGTTITTIQGVEINPKTATATIDKLAESFVGDESQILSILYQNGYQYTQDESLKGKDGYIYYDIKNGTYDYDQNKAIEFVKEDINNSIPVEVDRGDVMTETEKRAEDRAERRLQVEEKRLDIAIEQLGLEKQAAQGSYEAGDNIIVLDDSTQTAAKNYVKGLTTDNFQGQKILDVVDNFQTIFRKQKYDINSVVDVEKTPVKITRGGKERLVDLSAIKIFVPDVMDKPLFIPIAPTEQKGLFPAIIEPGERINLIMRLIDRAKKQGIKLTDDSFRTLMEDDFDKYNPVQESGQDKQFG